jgi:hypothetical protein
MVIEHTCPLVETPRVPRVRQAELFEIEMMAEFMAESTQECSERRDFLANRRPHPSELASLVRGFWLAKDLYQAGKPWANMADQRYADAPQPVGFRTTSTPTIWRP